VATGILVVLARFVVATLVVSIALAGQQRVSMPDSMSHERSFEPVGGLLVGSVPVPEVFDGLR
jgi:hypothetical protein